MVKKAEDTPDAGEQLQLIETESEYLKPIKAAAKAYKKALAARQTALSQEIEQKKKIIELTKKANFTPDAQGVIKYRVADIVVKITPRDELVRVKLDEDEAEIEGE